MNNIFITGNIRIGKSTSIKKILDLLNNNTNKQWSIGGYYCFRNVKLENEKTITTFNLISISNSSSFKILENTFFDNSNHVKIYSNNFDSFSTILEDDLQKCDFLILDEIGFAESKSFKYLNILYKVLDSEKVVLGVLKKHNCSLVNNIKSRDDVKLFTVDENNRDFLYKDVYENFIKLL